MSLKPADVMERVEEAGKARSEDAPDLVSWERDGIKVSFVASRDPGIRLRQEKDVLAELEKRTKR